MLVLARFPNFATHALLFDSQIVTRVLLNRPTYTDSVTASPYFSGIIFGSMVWVAFGWVSRLLQRAYCTFFVMYRISTIFGQKPSPTLSRISVLHWSLDCAPITFSVQ